MKPSPLEKEKMGTRNPALGRRGMGASCYGLRTAVVLERVGFSFLEMMDQVSRKCLSRQGRELKKSQGGRDKNLPSQGSSEVCMN